jgi:hypothetical protein
MYCKHEGLIKFVEEARNIIDFQGCGYDEEFIRKYVIHAALTVIEDAEKEKILSMKYGDFVKIKLSNIVERIIDFLDIFHYACKSVHLNKEDRNRLIELADKYDLARTAICHLYTCGINEDGIPFIIMSGIDLHCCTSNPCKTFTEVEVKSRFSEIAHYLSRLKQRFPDKSSFESKHLVSRVFAFNELRWIPVSKRHHDQVAEMLGKRIEVLYEKICKKIAMGSLVDECRASTELVNVVRDFIDKLAKEHGIERYYEFQYKGLEAIWNSLIEVIDDGEKYVVLEAPTGSGKSEVFLLSSILLSLAKKYLCKALTTEKCGISPIALIIYPRLALARDQFDRLVRYVWTLNKILMGIGEDPVTVSINNMEVLTWKSYKEAIDNQSSEVKGGYEVIIPVNPGKDSTGKYVEFTGKFSFFKCPDGGYPRIYNNGDKPRVVCRSRSQPSQYEDFNFVKIFRDIVEESPGDIHVTLFETSRLNLLMKKWERLLGRDDILGGPLLITIDEIHTYTGIKGARNSYVLRRLMTKIRRLTGREHGFVIIGLSATIPERGGEEFLKSLFLQESSKNIMRVRPERSDTIPAGSDYFYIIVPNFKEMVDAITVSIQTIMSLHLNMPSGSSSGKKTLAFADSLEVVLRLKHDLSDALWRGLQDLRNPFHKLFERTCEDYGEKNICESVKRPAELVKLLPRIQGAKSWGDGELWWPYSLELDRYPGLYGFNYDYVRQYTSKVRGNLDLPGIVVSTSSLELGVDYSDVIAIYQHGAPLSISALIQRAGRGGRRIFMNPLLRTAISIQLSPEIPHQSYLLEIFLRARNLREALNYEVLNVATENPELRKQTLVELMLDYYVLLKGDRVNKWNFECRDLPDFINNEKTSFSYYAREILKTSEQEVDGLIEEILAEIQRKCQGGNL